VHLLEALRAEHALVDAVVGSLRAWTHAWARGEGDAGDGRAYLRFFRRWAGDYHHAREEDVLFEALVRELGLPRERGPLAVIARDHAQMADLLNELEAQLGHDDAAARVRVDALATAYSHQLWHHIDAENSVLFPESEARLRRHAELSGRAPTDDELAAKREGEALLARFPPLHDATIFRGDGCIMCPAYGTTCEGLEREWWTESEWEEVYDRLTNM
jgi:hemerythrin-like domain-containing protein